jgi:exoribonuclease R
MKVLGKTSIENEEHWIFETRATGTDFINKIFKVDDRILSIWNQKRKMPIYSEKKIEEGFFRRNHSVWFNLKTKTAHFERSTYSGNGLKLGEKRKDPKESEQKGDVENLPNEFQDILSSIYYQREYKSEAEIGKSFQIDLFDDLKLTEMKIQILKEEELRLRINGEEQRIQSILVQPFIKTTGIFRSKGNIYIWISNDKKRIPLRIKAELPLAGHVTVELNEIQE